MGPNKKKTTTGHYENDSFSTGIHTHTHTHTKDTPQMYTHARAIFFCLFENFGTWKAETEKKECTRRQIEKKNQWMENKKQNGLYTINFITLKVSNN